MSVYDHIRLTAFHQGGAEVIGAFTADIDLNAYKNKTGINDAFTIRISDTLYTQLSAQSGGVKTYQDQSLLT